MPDIRDLTAVGRAVQSEIKASRIEDYLLIGGPRMSARAAAERLGVTPRTITRYRRELRGGQAACSSTGSPGAAQPATSPPARTPAHPGHTPTASGATATGPASAAAGACQQGRSR